MVRHYLLFSLVLLLGSFASAEDRVCQNNFFTIDARYEGGAFDKCKFRAHDTVELTIRPEDHKVIIEHPWYSFHITSHQPRDINIHLKFPDAYARYWPKLSTDKQNWVRAAESAVSISKNQKTMELVIPVDKSGTWVSAQELLTQTYYDQWLEELASHAEVNTAVIGMSVEGRPIVLAKTDNKKEAVVLLGRQHPSEVPGALAMREFVRVVLGESELARQFRARFTLLMIPLMNPDGVANGHWRHNSGRTDLNRDWGPFKQPETQSVARLLAGADEIGMQPRLMFDFHATKETPTMIFYTQIDEDVTNPENFANDWLGQVKARIPHYEFIHDPRPVSENKNTKGYFYTRYGIPSITYEIGDTADRQQVLEHTPVFAEEMMRELLNSATSPQ
jgi:predicted deacylase